MFKRRLLLRKKEAVIFRNQMMTHSRYKVPNLHKTIRLSMQSLLFTFNTLFSLFSFIVDYKLSFFITCYFFKNIYLSKFMHVWYFNKQKVCISTKIYLILWEHPHFVQKGLPHCLQLIGYHKNWV